MSFISLIIFLFIVQKIVEVIKKNNDRQASSQNTDQPMTWEEMEKQYGISIEQKEEPVQTKPTIGTPRHEAEVDAKMRRYQEAVADKKRSSSYTKLSSSTSGVLDLTAEIGQGEIGGYQDQMQEKHQRQLQTAARAGVVWAEILKAPKQIGHHCRHSM